MTGKAFGHRNKNDHHDHFPTHYSLTWQLLEREKFKGDIHEPFCGMGAIAEVLVDTFDIKRISFNDKNYGDNKLDFLEDTRIHNNIISNPPYGKLTDDLIIHAKKHTKNKIALLLRTNYLSGTTRLNKGVFENLEKVLIFSRMPDLKATIREDGKYPTAMIVFSWMIWNMKKKAKSPKIEWIDNQKYVLRKKQCPLCKGMEKIKDYHDNHTGLIICPTCNGVGSLEY